MDSSRRLLANLARTLTEARHYAVDHPRFRQRIDALGTLMAGQSEGDVVWLRHIDAEDEADELLHLFSDQTGITALVLPWDTPRAELAQFVSLLVEDYSDARAVSEAQASRHGHRHGDLDMVRQVLQARLDRPTVERLLQRGVTRARAYRNDELVETSVWVEIEVRLALTRAAEAASEAASGAVSEADRSGVNLALIEDLPDEQRDAFFQHLSQTVGSEQTRHWVAACPVSAVRRRVREGMLSLDELPAPLRAEVDLERHIALLLAAPDELRRAVEAGDQVARLDVLSAVPQLVSRGHHTLAEAGVARLTPEDGARLVQEGRVRWLAEAISRASGTAADLLSDGLARLGPAALPVVREIFRRGAPDAVCGRCAAIAARAADADWVVAQLKSAPGVTASRYLLKMLGDLGGVADAAVLKGYIPHDDPGVRRAAMEAAYQLGAGRAVPVLLAGLKDGDASVVCRALSLLERLKYRDPRFVRYLLSWLSGARSAESRVQLGALTSLRRIGNLSLGHEGSVESQLLALLPAPDRWRRIKVWRRSAEAGDPAVRVAICDALGQIGGPASMGRLGDTSGERDPRVRDHMRRALAALERRQTIVD